MKRARARADAPFGRSSRFGKTIFSLSLSLFCKHDKLLVHEQEDSLPQEDFFYSRPFSLQEKKAARERERAKKLH